MPLILYTLLSLAAAITIDTLTNGFDGIYILENSSVSWTYGISNAGNVPLSNVRVTDSLLGTITVVISGDVDNDGVLDVGETWVFALNGTAGQGAFNNTGTVTASFTDAMNHTQQVTASDPTSHWGAHPGVFLTADVLFAVGCMCR